MEFRASMRAIHALGTTGRSRATGTAVVACFILSVLFLIASASRLHAAPVSCIGDHGNAQIPGDACSVP
ncbi:MAG: hypothetical protein R3F21_02520 [Myxococcota bacterium]